MTRALRGARWLPEPPRTLPLGRRPAVADWEPPGAGELVRGLEAGLTPAAMVPLHDGGGDRSRTVRAVARPIPRLTSRGRHCTEPARDS